MVHSSGESAERQSMDVTADNRDTPDSGAGWLSTLPDRRLLGIGFVLLFALYLVSVPAVHTDADDAYQFSYEVENGLVAEGISRQILYIPVATAVFNLAQDVGWEGRPYGLLVVISALFAAATVCLTYLVLHRRLLVPRRTAIAGSGFLAFAYGYWRFAAEVEVYSLALFLALAVVYAALSDTPRLGAWAGIGLLAAVAFLMHGLNVFVGFLAVPLLLLLSRQFRRLMVYGSVLFLVVVFGTIVAYLAARESGESYLDFHGENGEIVVSVNNAQRAAVGGGQSLVSSAFLFSHDSFVDVVTDIAPNRSIADDLYLAQTIGPWHRWVMTATFAFSVATVLLVLGLAVPGLVRSWRDQRVVMAVVWLVVFTVFQMTNGFGADGLEVWLLALPPLVIGVVLGLEASPKTSRLGFRVLTVTVLAFVVHNGLGMLTLRAEEGDWNVARGEWLLENTSDKDLVMILDSAQFARYIQYETHATVVYLLEAAVGDRYIDDIVGDAFDTFDRVLATNDALDPPDWVRSGWPEFDQLVVQGEAMRSRFTLAVNDQFGGIYVLNDPVP